WILFRLRVLSNAETAVRIDAPRQLEPELILFPNLARIHLARIGDSFASTLSRSFHHGLSKPEPLRIVRFIGMKIVSLGADTHRQNVISVVGSFVPGGRERDVTTH